uniref:ATP synthase subunit 8 n=1 Tax=Macrocheles muscaedomesticae TaxID=406086 RepID=A0A6B9WHA6_9ACAR|nr:ATP synthase F0 subunit 8 [Macrocheles muscaedomesticae]QHQ98525.1 ATP synthase subunit 8 [Macrocheles muscaedomesticae]
MPQMFPMNWLLILMLSTISMYFIFNMLFFMKAPSQKSQKTKLNKNIFYFFMNF